MRILIAEDHVLLRAGLERLLGDAGHEVLPSVADAEGLLRSCAEDRPDLAVVDVTPEGFVLREVAPGVTPDEVVAATGAPLAVPGEVPPMALPATV